MLGQPDWNDMPTSMLMRHRDSREESVKHLEGRGNLNQFEQTALHNNRRELKAINEELTRRKLPQS